DQLRRQPAGARPIVAEAAQTGEHDVPVGPPERAVGEAQPAQLARPEAFHYRIRVRNEVEQLVPSLLRGKVELDAALPPVQEIEGRSKAAGGGAGAGC